MNAKLIELLNEALAQEYSDVFLYPREARTIQDKKVADKFNQFGAEELRHADIISMKLLELGERPAWDYTLEQGGTSLKEMLEHHLEKEKKYILLYNKCVEATDDDNFKILLKGIRANEESHLKFIEDILKSLT
ncbi:MAG: ferritin-like domain-containing protein [Deltaproteobacteria bacterium]